MTDRFSVIGAGRLGSALVRALGAAGYSLQRVWRKSKDPELAPYITDSPNELLAAADFVIIAVPESNIKEIAQILADSGSTTGRFFFHTSNSGSSELLDPVRRRGGITAAFSPLQTFPDTAAPTRVFRGISFLYEGDREGREISQAMAERLGALWIEVGKEAKLHIHMAAIAASNFLVSLLHFSATQLRLAGGTVRLEELLPLIHRTIENVMSIGPLGALSGPVQRRQSALIEQHMGLLGEEEQKLYGAATDYLFYMTDSCKNQKNRLS